MLIRDFAISWRLKAAAQHSSSELGSAFALHFSSLSEYKVTKSRKGFFMIKQVPPDIAGTCRINRVNDYTSIQHFSEMKATMAGFNILVKRFKPSSLSSSL